MDVRWGVPPDNVVNLKAIRRKKTAEARKATTERQMAMRSDNTCFPEPSQDVAVVSAPSLTKQQRDAFEKAWAALPTGPLVCLQTERQIREEPLLAPRNPTGWNLEDLLHQVHREVAETHRADVWSTAIEGQSTDLRRRLVATLLEAEILAAQLDDLSPGTKGKRRYGPGA